MTPEQIQALQQAAHNLDQVSDNLAQSIKELEETLKLLSLGVPAWVIVQAGQKPEWDRSIGYAKINGTWCIGFRYRQDGVTELTTFQSAPRWLRLNGTKREHLEELLSVLLKEAQDTTTLTLKRIEGLHEFTQELKGVIDRDANNNE